MRAYEFLLEGRHAPLYHGTTLSAVYRILRKNEIEANTYHEIDHLTVGQRQNISRQFKQYMHWDHENQEMVVRGVSLTRSFIFAKDWAEGRAKRLFEEPAVLRLDQNRLVLNRHKLIPQNFMGMYKHSSSLIDIKSYKLRREAEEFVIGPIKNVQKYITGIYVNDYWLSVDDILVAA